ncbi:MAG: GNAT family N-acetyltransferase, partial [Myxococcota bacterium]|nr:GNAT family N-acetyltransferase [Myxococcota bacterium]
VKRRDIQPGQMKLHQFTYETAVSTEHFLTFEIDDALLGFCRLSLPNGPPLMDELANAAMIREVHVYGQSLEIGQSNADDAQHRGLGRQLIERAAEIAADAGFGTLAVISSVGTRAYYRRLNFTDGVLYQHRALASIQTPQ